MDTFTDTSFMAHQPYYFDQQINSLKTKIPMAGFKSG